MNAVAVDEHAIGTLAGKYLTFQLSDEVYGLEILKVQEIIGLISITKVPRTPDFIRGVINLRGKVVPVIELRKKFRVVSVPDTEKTCIILVQVALDGASVTMGILVDEVSEVLDIRTEQLERTPMFGTTTRIEFILAIGKVEERVVMLLDVDKILSCGELSVIAEQGDSTQNAEAILQTI